jgi:hypothetical protein
MFGSRAEMCMHDVDYLTVREGDFRFGPALAQPLRIATPPLAPAIFWWNINANKYSGVLQLHRQNGSSVGGFVSQS